MGGRGGSRTEIGEEKGGVYGILKIPRVEGKTLPGHHSGWTYMQMYP